MSKTNKSQYARKIELGHDYTAAKRATKMPTFSAAELAKEVWVPVPVDVGVALEASSLGRLRVTQTKRVLSYSVNHSGYIITFLPYGVRPRSVAAAPLVWAAWNPTVCRDDNHVIFADGDKANLRPTNLGLMPHRRAVRRKKCIPVRIDDRVYPGAAEVAECYKVSVTTVVRWIARRHTRDDESIQYAPEYRTAIDGMTVRL